MDRECVFCTNCGSKNIKFENSKYICNSCQSIFEEERVNSKLFIDLTYANNERQSANFEKAKDIYQNIVKEYPNEDLSDVYWGLFLCNQNVIFEEDGKKEMFPSFYKVSSSQIQDDEYYKLALDSAKNSKENKFDTFKNLGEKVEYAKNMYLDISTTTKPFDVFICFKNSDKDGNHTKDRQLAMDIYNEFSGKYNIFFSEKTLKNIKSNYRNYEPNIYYGLYTAKVMLLICSSKEYIESQWLKNEWERFTQINKQGEKGKCIIPIFTQDFNPDNLPDALWHSQGVFDDIKLISNLSQQLETIINPVDLEKIRDQKIQQQMEELRKKQEEFERQREEAFNKKLKELSSSNSKTQQVTSVSNVTANSLLDRVEIFLEDGNFDQAEEYLDRVLDMEAKNSKAYLYKTLCDYSFKTIKDLTDSCELIYNNRNFQKALNYANEDYLKILEDYKNSCIYNYADYLFKKKQYLEAISFFEKIKDFKDSEKRIENCNKTLENIYNEALDLEKNYEWQKAINRYEKIINYKDCKQKIDYCKKGIECEKNYQFALKNSINIPKLVEVCDTLKKIDIPNYKDSDELLKSCGEILTQVYNQARSLETEYKFNEAIEKYNSIITFRDSKDRIKYCENGIKSEKKYLDAIELANKNKFYEAIDMLNGNYIKNYKDTEQKIEEYNQKIDVTYQEILKLRDNYEYAKAIELATKIIKYKDLKDVRKFCDKGLVCENNYRKGLEYKNEKLNPHVAKDCFMLIDIPNYKDVNELIRQCDEAIEKEKKQIKAKKRKRFLIKLSFVCGVILLMIGSLLTQTAYLCKNPFKLEGDSLVSMNAVAKMFVKEIIIPDEVVVLEKDAFKNSKLQNVVFGENLKTINNSAFENNKKLKTISSLENVTYLGDAVFKNCESLETVILSNELTTINEELFYNCQSLNNITLSDNIKTIYDNAFYNCKAFTKITMSDNVIYLGKNAFSNCDNLEEVVLSNNIDTFEDNVFANCKKLKSFNMPQNLSTIKKQAFLNCLAIEILNYPASLKTISETAFKGCDNVVEISRVLREGVIYIPNNVKILKLSGSTTATILRVQDDRTEDLEIYLDNVVLNGGDNENVIDFSNFLGKTIIYCKGSNRIRAGYNSDAVIVNNLELISQDLANLNIYGGNGSDGDSFDLNGKEGKTALKGGNIKIDSNLTLSLKGGNGGNGSSSPTSSRWSSGKRGGDGAAAGFAIICDNLNIENIANISLLQATDGNGGLGGTGYIGSDGASGSKGKDDAGNGFSGGTGVEGGDSYHYDSNIHILNFENAVLVGTENIKGVGGQGGTGGQGGRGGRGGDAIALHRGYNGGNGGDGGTGGAGGYTYTMNYDREINKSLTVRTGKGGTGGQGGYGGTGGAGKTGFADGDNGLMGYGGAGGVGNPKGDKGYGRT